MIPGRNGRASIFHCMKRSHLVLGAAICAVLAFLAVAIYWPSAAPVPTHQVPGESSSGRTTAAADPAPVLREPDGGRTPAAASLTPGEPRQYPLGQPALSPPDRSELVTTDRPPLADRLGARGTKPAEEPRVVLDVLDAYRRGLGAYPTGEDNRQIVNALLGANAQHLPFIPVDHARINARGEIVDAWNTPFFFHLESHDSIQVRSAGPDRVMFTADDIVAATPQPRNARPMIPAKAPAGP